MQIIISAELFSLIAHNQEFATQLHWLLFGNQRLQVQGVDTCLQIDHWLSSLLLSLAPTSLHPYQKPTIDQ